MRCNVRDAIRLVQNRATCCRWLVTRRLHFVVVVLLTTAFIIYMQYNNYFIAIKMMIPHVLTPYHYFPNWTELSGHGKSQRPDEWMTGLVESDPGRVTLSNDDVYVSFLNTSWATALIGRVWPRPVNEPDDRIQQQINFIDEYARLKGRNITKLKVILGVGHFNLEDFEEGQKNFIQNNCPITQCINTRNLSVSGTADAVLISEYGPYSLPRPPKPTHQVWIAQHWESPRMNRIDVELLRHQINWTASYRRESTVAIAYSHFEKTTNRRPLQPINYAAGKTKKVAMLVSNSRPSNNRMGYAKKLGQFIPVDIYGFCGTYSCPKNLPRGSVHCVKWMSEDYKFYLAFENSNCKDYITEKLLANALKNNILPIVYGASKADYDAIAPPHSYIHVEDFPSPQKLAEYLHILDKNDTLYNEYFAWKGTMDTIDLKYWCRLCAMLHLRDDIDYVHWYKDYRKWWNDVCPSYQTQPSSFS